MVLTTHMREGLAVIKDAGSIKFLKTDTELTSDGEIIYHYSISEDPNLEAKSYGIETVRDYLSPDQYRRALEIRKNMTDLENSRLSPATVKKECPPLLKNTTSRLRQEIIEYSRLRSDI